MKISETLSITYIPNLSNITAEQKEHCKTWIEALRSGKYLQAKGGLNCIQDASGVSGFCCLGVAGDCMVSAGKAFWKRNLHYDSALVDNLNKELPVGTQQYSFLNDQAQEYFGLPAAQGFICDYYYTSYVNETERRIPARADLVTLNDNLNLSFSQIADIVEAAINGGLSLSWN